MKPTTYLLSQSKRKRATMPKKTSPVIFLLAAALMLLACRLPSLPFLNPPTDTPEPVPTFLPTEPTTQIPPTATAEPPPTSTEAAPSNGGLENGGLTDDDRPTEEAPTEETPPDNPQDYIFDPDTLEPPLETWNDLPIYPGAVGGYGSGDDDAYIYFVDAPLADIQDFYASALTERGYALFTTAGEKPESFLEMYFNGENMIAVSGVRPEGEAYTMVVLGGS
jgi:hypothetical protein